MKKYIILSLVTVLLSSCAQQITRGEQYSNMYKEKPLTIAVEELNKGEIKILCEEEEEN